MLVEFHMIPLGHGESVGDLVAKVVERVAASGLPYQAHAMGTTVEGEWEPVMNLIRDCEQAMFQECGRVLTTMTIDHRLDHERQLEGKVASLERRLGHPLKR